MIRSVVLATVLPRWVPVEPLLLALVAFGAAMLLMNRGDRFFVNLRAQDEPAVVAIGVGVLVWGLSASSLGGVGAGAVIAASGVVARYTDRLDYENVIP